MSNPLNRLTQNLPFTAFTINDNVDCEELQTTQQHGSGVVIGMDLSAGALLVLNIAAGVVQNKRTVAYGGGTFSAPDNSTNYIMADWSSAVVAGVTVYTFTFSAQASVTPPGGQVCLGRVYASGGSITKVTTEGLSVLAHQSGSQFIVGQNRIVADDSTGITTTQTLQGSIAVKDHLVSGDSATISANYQVNLFGAFKVDSGASFTCSGRLRVTT